MEFTGNMVKAGSTAKNDLLVQMELGGEGIELELHSKVQRKFGEAIREDVMAVLKEYGIGRVKIQINDLGAMDFAVKARMETAVKRALLVQQEERK